MRRRLLVCGLSAIAAVLGCTALAPTAQAATKHGVVTVQTVPPVKGMKYVLRGRTLHADGKGRLRLNGDAKELARNLKVLRTPVKPGVFATLGRYYPTGDILSVTVSYYYRARPVYINLQGKEVDPSVVSALHIKGVHGKVYKFHGSETRWLHGSRVVTAQTIGRKRRGDEPPNFRVKRLDYGVKSAMVEGSNVVNEGQQRFIPGRTGEMRVRLLLYSAHFQTRDSFFGWPIGSAIMLTHPSGRIERYELEDGGGLTLRSLPRGDYEVTVVGPGFSFTRPVALSRNQEVELEVLSYMDLGLVLFVMAAFVFGLPLISRPHLLSAAMRRLRALSPRRRREAATSYGGGA